MAWDKDKLFCRVPKNREVIDALPQLSAEECAKYIPYIRQNMSQADIAGKGIFELMITIGKTFPRYNHDTKQDDRFEIVKAEKIENGYILLTTKTV